MNRYEIMEHRLLLDASAELLRDLNTSPVASEHAWLNDSVFFAAKDTDGDIEVWQSDGTTDGTRLVRDIRAEGGAYPRKFTRSGEHVFFTAFDDEHGRELWRTDGTENGTIRLTDALAGPADGMVETAELQDANGKLFFTTHREAGTELWTSDGTVEGTSAVVEYPIATADEFRETIQLTAVGDSVYFARGRPDQIWISDGTESGTQPIRDVWPSVPIGIPSVLLGEDEKLYFSLNGEIWKLDSNGPVELFDAGSQAFDVGRMAVVGERLYFSAKPARNNLQQQLWTTDGTVDGTRMLYNFRGHHISHLHAAGDRIYYYIVFPYWEEGGELWVTDGTFEGTDPVWDFDDSDPVWDFDDSDVALARGIIATDDSLFVVVNNPSTGTEVFRVDENDVAAIELNSGIEDSDVAILAANDDYVLAWNGDPVGLWQAPLAPTKSISLSLISDQISGPTADSFHPEYWNFAAFSTKAGDVFNTAPIVNGEFSRLYITDGTVDGTQLIDSLPAAELRPINSVNFQDSVFVSLGVDGTEEIWRTDGTQQGSYQVSSISADEISQLTVAGDSLFFLVRFGQTRQLWRSDGTGAGTNAVSDLPIARAFVEWQGSLYFASQREEQVELWKSDGTADGTFKITEIADQGLHYFLPSGDHLFIQLNGQLWRTDGTLEGTQFASEGYFAAVMGDLIYFVRDHKLWKTDGTALGTHRLFALPEESKLLRVWAVEDRLILITENREPGPAAFATLWSSDGTREGTAELTPVNYGHTECSSFSFGFSANGDTTYFTNDGDGHGCELWQTDGTKSGTMRISDIAPGLAESTPKYSSVTDGALYFTADDGFHGREVYRFAFDEPLPGDANGDQTVDFADFLILSSNFGKSEQQTFADGNFDGDEDVDFADFLLLSENFGKSRSALSAPE